MVQPESVGREVLYECAADHVALITLNRPQARNAIDGRVTEALGYLVKQVEEDPDIRAIVIASSHEAVFCAGADLREIAAGRLSSLFTADGGFAGFQSAKRAKPWIAAVRGAALAAGFEMVLGCDMVVAGEGATFGLPEVKRGLFPGVGVVRLPLALPRNVALELLCTGEPMSAIAAHRYGLVNRVVRDDCVLEAALALAASIAANAPLAVRGVLEGARAIVGDPTAQTWTDMSRIGGPIMSSEDAKEGARAFVEKRAPRWSGC